MMSEVTDLVMPVLQKIGAEQSSMKSMLADHSAKLNEVGETLEALSGYNTCQMGLTSRNQSDIKELQGQVKELTKRVSVLETGH
jgi:predicted nuclease with TOPRIM domain